MFICYFKKCIYYNYKKLLKLTLKLFCIFIIYHYTMWPQEYIALKVKIIINQNLFIYNANNYVNFLIGYRKFINLWNML